MISLATVKRSIFGKKVEGLRQQGLIPAELYGRGKENIHLSVPRKEFQKVWKDAGENTVVALAVDGESAAHNVMIHDIDHDPLTQEVTHIDFYEVRMDEKIT